MSKLLIQDDILYGMDVYVEYTIDNDDAGPEVILYDYGLELTNETPLHSGSELNTIRASLRGFMETRWMPAKLVEYIEEEEGLVDE